MKAVYWPIKNSWKSKEKSKMINLLTGLCKERNISKQSNQQSTKNLSKALSLNSPK